MPASSGAAAFPGAAASSGAPSSPGAAASPGAPAFPGTAAFSGAAFADLPQFDGQPPHPPDLADPWSGRTGPPPAPAPAAPLGPRPRQGRALAAGLAALVVLVAGLLIGLANANSGGHSAPGAAGLNLGTSGGQAADNALGHTGGQAAAAPAGHHHPAAAPGPSGTNGAPAGTGTARPGPSTGPSTKPAPSATPSPSPSSTTAGPPAGYRWYSVSAAGSGATAGFTIAIPDTWQPATQGLITYVTSPAARTRAEISLRPFAFANPVREARLQQRQAIRRDRFPGYVGLGIVPGTFESAPDAVWQYSWRRPAGGRMSVLDLLVRINTSAGEQSYALSISAPKPGAAAAQAIFQQMLQTFKPVP